MSATFVLMRIQQVQIVTSFLTPSILVGFLVQRSLQNLGNVTTEAN